MSKKTSFLKKLFNRVDRDGLRRRKSRRPEAQVEQLEKRIALAVDVVVGVQGGSGEQWLTVLANDGSDVYMQMASDDLLIADNSSFSNSRDAFENIADVDTNYSTIYAYNGSLVDQQVKFASEFGYSPDIGLLPTSYPDANTQELTFLLGSERIDTSVIPATGALELGDAAGTTLSLRSDGQNGWELIGSNSPVSVGIGSSGGLATITITSPALVGAGTSSMPILTLNYDTLDVPGNTNTAVTTHRSGVASDAAASFKLFNETTHQFVPGTLKGEVAVYWGDQNGLSSPRPIAFQVETTGVGVVPLSFGSPSNTEWTDGQVRQPAAEFDGTVREDTGNTLSLSFGISGEFHTETGELFLFSTTAGNSVRLPLHLDNLQIGLRDLTPADDATDTLGTSFDNFANDLTLFPGGTFTRSIVAELPQTASEISIENPLVVAAGTNDGLVSLSAGKVSVNSAIRAAGQFVIPGARTTTFGTSSEIVDVNALISSPSFDIRLDDNDLTGNSIRSRFKLSQQGSLSDLSNVLALPPATLPPANQIYLEVEDGDAFIEGVVAANNHSYVMRSGENSEVNGPYVFTTASEYTGVQTGEIQGQLLSMLLANDTLGARFESYQTMVSTVDLQTSVDRLRMQAATRQGHSAEFPFPYDISIQESGNLIVDAVSASSGEIDIQVNGSLTFLSTVKSMGDIKLESGDDFVVSAPVSTSFGSIDIRGPQVNVANSVRIYGGVSDVLQNDISIEATDGQLLLADAVAAINGVKLTARGPNGSISGDGRIIGDTIGAESSGDIIIRTDANGVTVRTPGVVQLDDQTSAAFEVFDSPDVTLTANGQDDVVEIKEKARASGSQSTTTLIMGTEFDGWADIGLGGEVYGEGIADNATIVGLNRDLRQIYLSKPLQATISAAPVRIKSLSPALLAEVNGALNIAVSAPQGSINVLHDGTQTVELGDGDAIAASQPAGVGVMSAAGSVVIRSNSAREMLVSDAPSASSGAETVRFVTSRPLPEETKFAASSKPGAYPTLLTTSLEMNDDKSVDILGGVLATDIKTGDLILLKDGRALHSETGLKQVSDSQLEMPSSFEVGDEGVVNKMIQGDAFAPDTLILSYDENTRILQISKPVVKNIEDNDTVYIVERDAGYCNGIYGVAGIKYINIPGEPLKVELSLRRSSMFDTTSELSGRRYVRVTDAATNGNRSSAGKVFVSRGFSNRKPGPASTLPTPFTVTPVLSRPGYLTVNAVSTVVDASGRSYELQGIPAVFDSEDGEIVALSNGAIGFDTEYFDGVVLGENLRVLIKSPLEDLTTTEHYGVYFVKDPGSPTSKWTLARYDGEVNSDGDFDRFYTGTVAITQGSLRTAATGLMYEISYDSINQADLIFEEITDFRDVTTEDGGTYVTEDYNALDQYRVDIGTRNVLGEVTYQVASDAGDNESPSSLGRIMRLVQSNTATVDRLGEAQLTQTTFHDSVQNIQLEQELPVINSPIQLIPDQEIIIDGSRIVRTRNGAVVRSGALRARLGPASPSLSSSARRLVRGVGEAVSFEEVNGLEIAPGGRGTVVGNISIGGFRKGAGISIVGADNVLLNDVRVGVDKSGNPMPNAVGIRIDQAAGGSNAQFTTVRNSRIAANTEAGISLGTNVDGVRVVGSVIGENNAGNEAGVIIDTGESGLSRIGVRQINPSAAVVGLPVTPLESYPGNIPGGMPIPTLPSIYDPVPTSRVSVSKNKLTDAFEPGLQLFERTTNRMWTVRQIELSADELNHTLTVTGPQIDAATFGMPLALEAGYFVDTSQRAETLRLPPGVDPARLYLGQVVLSTVPGVFEAGTFITSITILPPPELPQNAAQFGHYGGIVEVGLSRPVALSAKTGLIFQPPGINEVGFNNDGIILKSGSSNIVATNVISSNFDGIRIEGVASSGKHTIGGAKGIDDDSLSPVQIRANLVSGISFTDRFFADLAEDEKPRRFDQVKIQNNLFGGERRSDGSNEPIDIVIADASLEHEHQRKEDRDGTRGRYKARHRPEDNPNQLEELEEFEGLDTEGNDYTDRSRPGTGDGGFDDGDDDGGSGFPTW